MEAIIGHSDEKTVDLERFQKWLPTVPRNDLERLLVDALWKGHLDDTEIRRFFLIECLDMKHGKHRDKPDQMIRRPVRSREYRLFKAWLEELRWQPTIRQRKR